ncbi:hypothetical protein JTB14_034405 [Gonioctena quinquepunctata]|nr:hypothetical protein JTB14_034405 [Gonioctena quinquepunctata]
MSQEELYALIQSDEEILVPPSDLESECSDRDEGSEDQDMFTLHDVDELVLEDSPEYKDLSSDWDSEDDLPLSTIRKNTILQKEPTWSNLNKPTPSGTFDKTNSGVPNFIKQMQGWKPWFMCQVEIRQRYFYLLLWLLSHVKEVYVDWLKKKKGNSEPLRVGRPASVEKELILRRLLDNAEHITI